MVRCMECSLNYTYSRIEEIFKKMYCNIWFYTNFHQNMNLCIFFGTYILYDFINLLLRWQVHQKTLRSKDIRHDSQIA